MPAAASAGLSSRATPSSVSSARASAPPLVTSPWSTTPPSASAPRRVPSRSTAAITPSNWPRSPTSPATACFPSSVQPLPKYDYPSPAWIRIPPSLNYSAGVYGGVVRVEGKVLLEVCLELAQKEEFLPLLFHCADQGCK